MNNQATSNQTVSNQTIELLQNHRVYREFDSSATVPDSQLNDIIK
ncbi:NADPH-dependent oxidoreductase, partial [Salmonella enterica subsp. enterica serovar Anatum]|nr:NADPH-dependent oxidoreductase [Salmonella enterica subsp. enterica serovar Anatum]